MYCQYRRVRRRRWIRMRRRFRTKCLDSIADLEKYADMAREVNLRLFGDVDVDDSGGSDGDRDCLRTLRSCASDVPSRITRSSKLSGFKPKMSWYLKLNLVLISIILLFTCVTSVYENDDVDMAVPLPSNENERSKCPPLCLFTVLNMQPHHPKFRYEHY